jgi:hypothetical protein
MKIKKSFSFFCKLLIGLFFSIAIVISLPIARQFVQKTIYGYPIELFFQNFIIKLPLEFEMQIVNFNKKSSFLSYGFIPVPKSIVHFFKRNDDNELSYLYLKSINGLGKIYLSERMTVANNADFLINCTKSHLQCTIKKNALGTGEEALEYQSENNIVYIFTKQKVTVRLQNIAPEELQHGGIKFTLKTGQHE